MSWNFEQISSDAKDELAAIKDARALEDFRIKYLGKKGLIQQIYASLAQASAEEKPLLGKNANILKIEIVQSFDQRKIEIEAAEKQQSRKILDVTLPGVSQPVGVRHVLNQTMDQICGIFEGFGFVIEEGPEVETEFHNFDALNIPKTIRHATGSTLFMWMKKIPKIKS